MLAWLLCCHVVVGVVGHRVVVAGCLHVVVARCLHILVAGCHHVIVTGCHRAVFSHCVAAVDCHVIVGIVGRHVIVAAYEQLHKSLLAAAEEEDYVDAAANKQVSGSLSHTYATAAHQLI